MRVSRISVVLFCLTLGALTSHAAELPGRASLASGPGWLTQIISAVQAFLFTPGEKEGCAIDPWGRCAADQPKSGEAELRCGIDPWGNCDRSSSPLNGSEGESGCAIDPWGRCIP